MPDELRYLAVLGACLLVTLPLWFFPGVRVGPRRFARAVLPVAALFVAWDLLGVGRGHWGFSERFTTGWAVGPLPVEELLFFLVVPLCTLLTWEAVGSVSRLARGSASRRGPSDRGDRGAPGA